MQDRLMILFNLDDALLETSPAGQAILAVIRWFQIQPDTYVGVNTTRPERLRSDTLHRLNQVGLAYQVSFANEQLYLSSTNGAENNFADQIAVVHHFQKSGKESTG